MCRAVKTTSEPRISSWNSRELSAQGCNFSLIVLQIIQNKNTSEIPFFTNIHKKRNPNFADFHNSLSFNSWNRDLPIWKGQKGNISEVSFFTNINKGSIFFFFLKSISNRMTLPAQKHHDTTSEYVKSCFLLLHHS